MYKAKMTVTWKDGTDTVFEGVSEFQVVAEDKAIAKAWKAINSKPHQAVIIGQCKSKKCEAPKSFWTWIFQ